MLNEKRLENDKELSEDQLNGVAGGGILMEPGEITALKKKFEAGKKLDDSIRRL